MPLYTYECNECQMEFDILQPLSALSDSIPCSECGRTAKRVIVVGHGGIQTDGDVKWLGEARQTLQPDGERPIETRGQYRNYLKENGIVERC